MPTDAPKLPKHLDFHRATSDLPLPRATRSTVQIYLATRTKQQIKDLIEQLDDTINDLLDKTGAKMKDNRIIIPKRIQERERREIIQHAMFTKAIRDFTEKYLISLELQKKI